VCGVRRLSTTTILLLLLLLLNRYLLRNKISLQQKFYISVLIMTIIVPYLQGLLVMYAISTRDLTAGGNFNVGLSNIPDERKSGRQAINCVSDRTSFLTNWFNNSLSTQPLYTEYAYVNVTTTVRYLIISVSDPLGHFSYFTATILYITRQVHSKIVGLQRFAIFRTLHAQKTVSR